MRNNVNYIQRGGKSHRARHWRNFLLPGLLLIVFFGVNTQSNQLQSQNIVAVEYFVNSDPGLGNGIPLSISPAPDIQNLNFELDISNLDNGFNHLYVRAKAGNGKWSLTNMKSFFKEPGYALPQNIVKAEYFINTDPGFGNATDIPVTTSANITGLNFLFDISDLPNGFHNLYIRVRDENGHWSLTNVKSFLKTNAYSELQNIVKAEYFLNTDPGFGNATDVPVIPSPHLNDVSFTVDITDLQSGFNLLYLRARDENGNWSLTNVKAFYKEAAYATPQNIVKAEYYINTDPGAGNAINIPVTPASNINGLTFLVDIDELPLGFHYLFVRTKCENGIWSQTNVQTFFKEKLYADHQNIVKAEYFLNTDPGFGNATDIPLNPEAGSTGATFLIDMAGFPLGFHYLSVRTKDENGIWSLTTVKTFFKEKIYADPQNVIQAEYFYNSDPGFGNGINIPLTPAPVQEGIIFFADNSHLPIGLHRFFVRTKDQNGQWSLSNWQMFLISCPNSVVDFEADYGCTHQPMLFTDISSMVYPLGTYHWNFGDGSPVVVAPKGNIEHIYTEQGQYIVTLTVYNRPECFVSNFKTITVHPSPEIPTNLAGNTSLCMGADETAYTTSGSAHSDYYEWELIPPSAGNITGITTTAVVQWNPLFVGTAQVRVRGVSIYCTGPYSEPYNVVVNPLPEVSLPNDFEVCYGDPVTLSATYAHGTVSWSHGVLNGVPFILTETTTFTATVVSSYGCGTVSETITVTVNPLPELILDHDFEICFGDEITLTATYAHGTLSWSDGVENGVPFTPDTTATYTATVISLYGCEPISKEITITVNPLPELSLADDFEACDGDYITLSANFAHGTISWSHGIQNGVPFIIYETTTYTATVVSAYGCGTISETITITVNPSPELNTPEDFEICLGEEATLTATYANGTLLWSHGIQNGVPFTPQVTTTYSAVVISSYGCDPVTKQVTITVNPQPELSLEDDFEVCYGEQVSLSANYAHGTVSWSHGVEDGVPFIAYETTTYTATVVSLHGCGTISETITVTVNTVLTLTCPDDFSICYNDETFLLSGALPEGGHYSGNTVENNFFNPAIAGPGTHPITYSLENENGCWSSCVFQITVNPLPQFECPVYGPFTAGDEPVVFTGPGVYTLQGEIVLGFDPVTEGVYNFIYTETNEFGCQSSCGFSIVVYPFLCAPPINLSALNINNPNAVVLNWNPVSSETSWHILYGISGFDPETEGVLITPVIFHPYLLTGLQAATIYDFYVRAVCEVELSEWSDKKQFFTDYNFLYETLIVQNSFIQSGQDTCFQAALTLTVAGGGTSFIVDALASAKLVAGYTVRLLPGTRVHPQGHLHAYIDQSGTFCNAYILPLSDLNANLLTPDSDIQFDTDIKKHETISFFTLFPNPTAGTFVLQLKETEESTAITVEIYSMIGERILQTRLSGQQQYEFDLSSRPGGVYLIRIVRGEEVGVEKVVKQ